MLTLNKQEKQELLSYSKNHTVKECAEKFKQPYKSVWALIKNHGQKLKLDVPRHGYSKERLYWIYSGMKARCLNKNEPCYKHYGGRGIKICSEWLKGYVFFRSWALSHGYQDNLTIDRLDVNGNYEPSNCRWVTVKEQANNRRDNLFLVYNGESKTLQQWSDTYGINRKTLQQRLQRGLTLAEALNKDLYKGNLYTFQGKTLCLKDWARELGISYSSLHYHVRICGKTLEETINYYK